MKKVRNEVEPGVIKTRETHNLGARTVKEGKKGKRLVQKEESFCKKRRH